MDRKSLDGEQLMTLTADIVAAHVSKNHVAISDVSSLIRQVYDALSNLAPEERVIEEQKLVPAVPVKNSIKPDHLVCLVCGSKQKTLKRHLNSAHGLSPQDYRVGFNLPGDYPMVAASYSKRRSEMAQAIGLGRKERALAPIRMKG